MDRKMKLCAAGVTLGLAVIIQSGCAGTPKSTQSPEQSAPAKKEAAESAVKEVKTPEPLILKGKVVETMNAGGYTYVLLEKDGKQSWAAMPFTKVEVGQEVEVRPGTQMGKFSSMSLRRTFDDITFSSGLVTDTNTKAPAPTTPQAKDAKDSLPQGHPPMDAKPQNAPEQSIAADQALPKGHQEMVSQPNKEAASISGKVVETMDAGGYTYVLLENSGKKVWVAVPTMKVSVGQELKLKNGAEFTHFKSKTLNRSFDSIIFSAGEMPAKP